MRGPRDRRPGAAFGPGFVTSSLRGGARLARLENGSVGYCIAGRVMNDRTVRALNAINRRFYCDTADAFDATRADPWPGWTRLLDILAPREAEAFRAVLDVGCGNGRFAATLIDVAKRGAPVHYTGVDSSTPLLDRVRARALPFPVDLHHCDLVEASLDTLPRGPFSGIALFAVLHHVPSVERRRALLSALGERLTKDGWLAAASWQFEAFARFRDRLMPWETYNQRATVTIDTSQLEPGDHLLPWGDGEAVRYCHFTNEADTRALLREAGFEPEQTWAADGREGNLNRYVLCRFSDAQLRPKEGEQGR